MSSDPYDHEDYICGMELAKDQRMEEELDRQAQKHKKAKLQNQANHNMPKKPAKKTVTTMFPDELDPRQKFEILMKKFPSLQRFWNEETKRPDIVSLSRTKNLSSGETIIANCLLSIWTGSAGKSQQIDFTDLATLPIELRSPFIHWLVKPFWP